MLTYTQTDSQTHTHTQTEHRMSAEIATAQAPVSGSTDRFFGISEWNATWRQQLLKLVKLI